MYSHQLTRFVSFAVYEKTVYEVVSRSNSLPPTYISPFLRIKNTRSLELSLPFLGRR